MAKSSIVARNRKRSRLVQRMKPSRSALKERIRVALNMDERDEAISALQRRRRDESPVRMRNRCCLCGRAHGTLRKFGLCRIHLRELAMRGEVPGLRKASW